MSETTKRGLQNELLRAVFSENADAVAELFRRHDVDPDAAEDAAHPSGSKLPVGFTALMGAAYSGNCAIVKTLLDAGADWRATDPGEGYFALYCAAQRNHVAAARLLLARGAAHGGAIDMVTRARAGGASPVYIAAQCGNESMLRLLAEHGASVTLPNAAGTPPLLIAAQKGHVRVVRALLQLGASPNTALYGTTAAFAAAKGGHVATLRLLLERGGSHLVTTPDKSGFSPLLAAAKYNHAACVRLLVDRGADPNDHVRLFADTDALAPMRVAALQNAQDALRALLQVGGDAFEHGAAAVAELKHEHGVDITQLLGDELVGHEVEIRYRPSHLEEPRNPLDLQRGARVALHSLAGDAKLNGALGVVTSALSAEVEGRYRVRLSKLCSKTIRPSNLRGELVFHGMI